MKVALCGATMLAGVAMSAQAASPVRVVSTTVQASQPVSFTVTLPLRNRDKLEALLADQQDEASPNYHKWLTPTEFGLRFGPASGSMERVAAALQARGFEVTKIHTRSLSLRGTAALVQQHFGTPLQIVRGEGGRMHVAAAGAIHMPAELAAENAGVVGLEPLMHHSMARSTGRIPDGVDNRFSPTGNYYYTDLKQAYVYPSHDSKVTVGGVPTTWDGTGATIATVISSDVLDSDVQSIFEHEHFSTTSGLPDPTIFARRAINGGAPFDPSSNDSFEASLDIQAELTGAPGAHVILYNIPSLADSDIIDGYTAVIDDNDVDAVSSSFGICESYYEPKYNGGMDFTATPAYEHELYQQGNAQGITFLASSGDQAGKECINTAYFNGKPGRYIAGASSPAIDPNVTGVGGTNVVTVYDVGSLNSAYAGENAWLDQEADADPYGLGNLVTGKVWGAGGGTSVTFAAPLYQSKVATGSTMRVSPDVGMQVGGCPGDATDYQPKINKCNGGRSPKNGLGNTDRSDFTIYFGGGRYGVIGTSVSSPEFTSAVAYLIEKKGRQGNLNEYIYKLAAAQAAGGTRTFHTEIPGYNGVIPSNISPTYNVSTGVGTPIVSAFLGRPSVPAAGIPQTSSNP